MFRWTVFSALVAGWLMVGTSEANAQTRHENGSPAPVSAQLQRLRTQKKQMDDLDVRYKQFERDLEVEGRSVKPITIGYLRWDFSPLDRYDAKVKRFMEQKQRFVQEYANVKRELDAAERNYTATEKARASAAVEKARADAAEKERDRQAPKKENVKTVTPEASKQPQSQSGSFAEIENQAKSRADAIRNVRNASRQSEDERKLNMNLSVSPDSMADIENQVRSRADAIRKVRNDSK
jgi:hypothetical protein